ncbi:MAG: flagellar filament capping protein FliD [Desulfovibrio sp.]|jgi:flagellar capping protein FliD|nr:flagellar filament capping protein FliD [Desulfovibrio sp.]
MASTLSGSNAISGLSGMDTNFDTVLAQLKKIEQTQVNRLEAWKADWSLRYEAFGQIIDQVKAASSMLTTLTDRNHFVTKNVTSSDSNVVTAVASALAQDVQHTITVNQVASNAIWANTGHVFSSKSDIINTTGTTQTFEYTYAGKDYSVSVAPNTTLESFMYLVNNAVGNPGVKVSLIQNGSGYVFQVAGQDTGAKNDLYIHSSQLLGMDLTGATTTWETNSPVDGSTIINDPNKYTMRLQLSSDDSYVDIEITNEMTSNDIVNAINMQITNSPPTASLDATGKGLVLNGIKSVSVLDENSDDILSPSQVTYDSVSDSTEVSNLFTFTDGTNDYLNEPNDLTYTFTANDGNSYTINTGYKSGAADATYENILNKIQSELDATYGIHSDIVVDPTDNTKISLEADNILNISGPGLAGQVVSSSNWSIQNAANAKFQVDNWPMEMESASNSVSDVIEGVVFSLQDVGTAKLSISTDITSVEQSIQNFLDAVNSVLITIRELTKYDSDKEVTSTDPDSSNYSPSQLTAEKGGLLQGNYGVQLFKTRFSSLLTSSPPGFTQRTSATDILSGDLIATLSAMGIKTNTDQTSETYGLLEIAPDSSIAELKTLDMERYNDMITNHLQDVVDFFCTSGTGTTTSSDFRYGSHIEGITKAGTYDVSYTVDASGAIEHVYIGGVEAKRDTSMPGYYYSVASGDAKGLSIVIDNLSQGDHTGQVRIKEGLVQTVNSFLKAELQFTDVSASTAEGIEVKSQNGALMVLRDNYKKIMENIDKKIAQEEERIALWEARQKAAFARLETLLANYGEIQSSLESSIAQLSSD